MNLCKFAIFYKSILLVPFVQHIFDIQINKISFYFDKINFKVDKID